MVQVPSILSKVTTQQPSTTYLLAESHVWWRLTQPALTQESTLGDRQRYTNREFFSSLLWTYNGSFTIGVVTPLPSDEQKACQSPKPILLNTVRPGTNRYSDMLCWCYFQGFAHTPYEWSPSTVDVQMLRVGNLGKESWSSVAHRLITGNRHSNAHHAW